MQSLSRDTPAPTWWWVTGTQAHAESVREDVATVLAPIGLRLSETKTKVCHIDELANHGVGCVLIFCCDGLTGFPTRSRRPGR